MSYMDRKNILSEGFFDKPLTTLLIKSPMCENSFVPKPLVVPAGVPSLIPEVTQGLSVSKGIPFLLQVIFERPRLASASFPVTL